MAGKRRGTWIAAVATMAVGALLAAGCGSSSSSSKSGGGGKSSSTKAGLVTDTGGLNDRSFNALAYKGLKQADSELGVKTSVLESKAASDYGPNLGKLTQGKNDLVIGVGFLMGDAIASVAKKSPSTDYAIIDFSYGAKTPKNVRGLLFKEQEAGYLAGVLAGKAEVDGKLKGLNAKHVVSTVGGQKIPPVDHYIAGFQAGVKSVCPDCTTLNDYSQDFTAQDKCKEIALNQIAKGSDIVFQVAGGCGLGALDAAKQKGVWGIGVDADQANLGSHILTSALKRVDVAVYDTVEAESKGKFDGGSDGVYGLKEDGVGLGKVAPDAQQYQGAVDAATKDITSGKVVVPDTVA